jgi:RimJ/RimL family protein N-acetyltransferase
VIPESIHAFLRAGGAPEERERIGPFLIRLAPDTKHPMLNYAVPDEDARPSDADVDTLVKAFESRGLLPRLEYASGGAPALEEMLHRQGFSTEARLTIMICRPGEERLAEVPPGFKVVLARSDEDHADAIVVADQAYGEPGGTPDRTRIEGRRRQVQNGGAVVLARHLSTGAPAGSGLFPVPRAGVTELAGVGTADAFRRRGVASAVTSCLLKSAFEAGVQLVWLTPEHVGSERIYARVGFTRAPCEMVHISRPRP